MNKSGYLTLGAVLAIALLVVTASGLGVLLMEEQEDARQATLEAAETERELEQQRSTYEQAQEERDSRIRALEENGQELELHTQELELRIEDLSSNVTDLEERRERLQESSTDLRGTILQLVIEVSDLDAQIVALEQDNADLRTAHGTVVSLEEEAEGLRVVISGLEEDRQALELKAQEMLPVCTGSMEPKITCLDTVVVLQNYFPEDIAVGTVIFFDSPEADDGALPILHRVKEIKIEDGVHYFLPKGDAAETDDGVWVPEENVRGYVIELLQGTRPENTELRERVNGAKEQYVTTKATMLEARGAFDETAIRYCGSVEAVSACETSASSFNRVLTAYNTFKDAYDEYLVAICAYDEAYYHGLHESVPGMAPVDPYETPSICS